MITDKKKIRKGMNITVVKNNLDRSFLGGSVQGCDHPAPFYRG